MKIERWASIDAIKATNRASGGYWFTPDTMRFFRSRIGSRLVDGRFFVTSETPDSGTPRRYSVRMAYGQDARIETMSGFREFTSAAQAYAWIGGMLRMDHPAGVDVADDGRYRGVCPCGWVGVFRSADDASADYLASEVRQHIAIWAS